MPYQFHNPGANDQKEFRYQIKPNTCSTAVWFGLTQSRNAEGSCRVPTGWNLDQHVVNILRQLFVINMQIPVGSRMYIIRYDTNVQTAEPTSAAIATINNNTFSGEVLS